LIFNKAAFTGLAIAVVAGLVVLMVLMVGRLKMVSHEIKEKTEALITLLRHWRNTNAMPWKSRSNFPANYKTNATGFRKCAVQKCSAL